MIGGRAGVEIDNRQKVWLELRSSAGVISTPRFRSRSNEQSLFNVPLKETNAEEPARLFQLAPTTRNAEGGASAAEEGVSYAPIDQMVRVVPRMSVVK